MYPFLKIRELMNKHYVSPSGHLFFIVGEITGKSVLYLSFSEGI